MRIGILGMLVVDGATPNRREATMLAVLALTPGRQVAAATLADAYWGETPPPTWPKQVQGAISRLRSLLGPGSITTGNGGYALDVSAVALDSADFAAAVDEARRFAGSQEFAAACDELSRALQTWRGSPFAELAEWGPAQAEISRLEDLRLTAEEDFATAMVEAGDLRGALTLAERMVIESPYREERWAVLALAAYRAGRQTDALSALRAARRKLRDDLGIEPGERLVTMEQAILDHSPWLLSTALDAEEVECPYRGLRSLGLEDARWFHGREVVVADTLATLERAGVVTVVGSSGSGKSSVALAGVAATMRERGWNVAVANPSDFGSRSRSADALLALAGPLLVVLDQFEELFAGDESADRVAVIGRLIGRLVARGDKVLVTVRSEFLDAVVTLPAVGPLLAASVQAVGPMTSAELRRAIEEPARAAQLRLEPGLSAVVLRDAAGSSTPLPLMSHALAEAWRRRSDAVLRVADYEAVGGIAGAIAESAEGLYASLSDEEQALCRTMLQRLVSQDGDGVVLRRRVIAADAADSPAERRVLSRLIEARLVTVQDGYVLLTHEAILTAWPRLSRWVSDQQEAMRVLSRLSTAAEEWDAGGRHDADLYRGPRLEAAEESARHAMSRMTSKDRAFLQASQSRADGEMQAAEDRRKADTRQRRRLVRALVTTAALFAISIVATTTAVVGGVGAVRSADVARAAEADASIEALLGHSVGLRASERDVGALIAAEMWRRWPDDPRSRAALMSVFTASGGLIETTYLDTESARGALVGDGPLAVVVDSEGARVRDLTTGEITAHGPLGIAPASIRDLVVSADGSTAAVLWQRNAGSGETSVLTTFDIAEPGRRAPDIEVKAVPDDVAISPDGRMLGVVSQGGGMLTVIDASSGATRSTKTFAQFGAAPEFTSAATVTFLPTGDLAVGTTGTELIVVDPTSLQILSRIAVPAFSAHVDAVVAGEQLIATGEQGLIDIDLPTSSLVWQRPGDPPKPTACIRLAASADTGRVYCADAYGRIAERSLSDGRPTTRRFDPQLGTSGSIGLFDDGDQLVAFGGSTPTVSRWSTDGGGAVTRLIAAGDAVLDGYGDDGRAVLVAERDDSVRSDFDMTAFSLWDPASDDPVMTLAGSNQGVGWAGPSLLLGYLAAAGGEAAFANASDGALRVGVTVPADASRGWLAPAGARYYLALTSGKVETLDVGTGESVGPTFDAGGFPVWVSASPDGSRVVITRVLGDGVNTGVFDARTGELLVHGLEGAEVTAVGPDDSLYAATDGRITVHDLKTLGPTGTIPGARGEVNSLQIDRAGDTMLVTANDETVSLIDLATGTRIGDAIPASAPQIIQGFLRPDGQQLVVNVEQGVQRWDLDPVHQYEAACRIAGRELTAQEWMTYLGELPRKSPTCAGVLP